MIAGGSRIAAYLATRLLDMNIAVKIIEKNLDKALDHALRFPDVTVICGDGTDQATLLSENLDGMDGFVSLTDNERKMSSFPCLQNSRAWNMWCRRSIVWNSGFC